MSESASKIPVIREVEQRLADRGATPENLYAVLEQVLGNFGCAVGTIHRFDPDTCLLHLQAHKGVPEAVLSKVRTIPLGKGMAGLAAERRQPVQVCNLQTGADGVANPAARDTKMGGSIAVPMLLSDKLQGVLGVARPDAHDFTGPETDLLLQVAQTMGKFLGGVAGPAST